ncbi:hypothetical protein FXO37_30288 [Capsicum annuum]|nr:hypothetical protein FXO37_30288 [Capsicum annuum]
MKYRIKNVPAHSLHFGSYCNRVFGSDIKNCAGEEAYNHFCQTIFGSFLDMPQCNFQGQIFQCILMLELEQGNSDEIHVYVKETILKFTILEFALISGLKCTGNIEEHLYTHSSKFVLMVVGIKVKYEKLMAGMFGKFVYTNLRSTHEEVQRLDLSMIDGVELNNDESALSHDIYPDHSDKRHGVDIHTQSDMDHQGFEDFSTVPPPEILMKASLNTHASTSQPTKKRRTIRFDTTTIPMQDSEKTPPSVSGKSMPIDQSWTSDSQRLNAPTLTPSSSGKSGYQDRSDQKWNELKFFLQSYDFEGFSSDVETSTLDAQVEEMVNQELEDIGTAILNALVDTDEYLSTISEFAQLEIDAIMQGLATSVDDIPLEVVKPVDKIVNLYFLSDSQISSNYPDSIVVAHLAAKTPAKRTRTRSRIFKSPNMIDFAFGSKALEDESTEFKQTFTFEGYEISDDMPSSIIEEYKKWVLEAVIALEDKRICVYDSLSNLRNMDSSLEIQKLEVMLPTFLSDSEIFEQTSRKDWPNLDAYRDKLSDTTQLLNTNSFEVEDCGVFVTGYAEYISEGMSVPSVGFEAAYHLMRYTSLLRNYGLQKTKKGYVSENEDLPRPRPTKHSIPDEMTIVRIG